MWGFITVITQFLAELVTGKVAEECPVSERRVRVKRTEAEKRRLEAIAASEYLARKRGRK